MAICPIRLLLASVSLLIAIVAPAAVADTALPDARTHVDAAGESPRVTSLKGDTSTDDLERGYLYVKAKCSRRCEIEVSARARVRGKVREIAAASKVLPARKTRRVKLRIKKQYRGKISPGARISFRAVPFPTDN